MWGEASEKDSSKIGEADKQHLLKTVPEFFELSLATKDIDAIEDRSEKLAALAYIYQKTEEALEEYVGRVKMDELNPKLVERYCQIFSGKRGGRANLSEDDLAVINVVGDGEQPLFGIVNGVDYSEFQNLSVRQMDNIYESLKPRIKKALTGRQPETIAKGLIELILKIDRSRSIYRPSVDQSKIDWPLKFEPILPGVGYGRNRQQLSEYIGDLRRTHTDSFSPYGERTVGPDGNDYFTLFGRDTRLSTNDGSPSPMMIDNSALVPFPDIIFMNDDNEPRRINGLSIGMLLSQTYPGIFEVPLGGRDHHDQQYASIEDLVYLYERYQNTKVVENKETRAINAYSRTENIGIKSNIACLLSLKRYIKDEIYLTQRK